MPTAYGTDTVTSIARRFILPKVTDLTYKSNVLLYRWMRANKMTIQGGTQIEIPVIYKRFSNGGAYRGLDPLTVTPNDTIKNAVFDWKQHAVTWAIDGLTMIRVDSPDSIANLLMLQKDQAVMEMAENLANGLFGGGFGTIAGYASAGTVVANRNPKDIDGLAGAVGDNAVGNASYGGFDRTTADPFFRAKTQAAVAMSHDALMSLFTNCTVGGQSPTIILSRSDKYNKYWSLGASGNYSIQHVREAAGADELLLSAGFTNLLFNNVPWVVDDHCIDGSTGGESATFMLNENFWHYVVTPRADFYLSDFQEPINQDGMVAKLLWAGNLVCNNPQTQGVALRYT